VSRPLLVLVHGSAWEHRYQAVTVAVTAASLGERVTVALFFDPLRRLVEGTFDEGAPPAAGTSGVGGLAAALADARALGLEIVACDTAVRLAGLAVESTLGRVDRIASLPSLWAGAREGRVLSFG
jgi:peroxiredoxin family protein